MPRSVGTVERQLGGRVSRRESGTSVGNAIDDPEKGCWAEFIEFCYLAPAGVRQDKPQAVDIFIIPHTWHSVQQFEAMVLARSGEQYPASSDEV